MHIKEKIQTFCMTLLAHSTQVLETVTDIQYVESGYKKAIRLLRKVGSPLV